MTSPTTRSFDTLGRQPSPEIAEFVSAVRDWLNDLSADEVTELTGGLEADLTDALAEAKATPSEMYGDPAKYASELRAAAGLPPRGAGGVQRAARPGHLGPLGRFFRGGLDRFFLAAAREAYDGVVRALNAQPWWPGVREFLRVLRPAWWVIRAWAPVQMLYIAFSSGSSGGAVRGGFGGLVLLLAAIVLSVQAGRREPLPLGLRKAVLAWNVVAVLCLVPAMFAGGAPSYYSQGASSEVSYDPPPGLSFNGQQLTNVFPYDSEGRPLVGVQLYDQDGRALETDENARTVYDENSVDTDASGEIQMVPGSPAGLAPRWNAFPLQQRTADGETLRLGPIRPAPQPFTGVPLGAAPTPSAVPTPPARAVPTPPARAVPTPSATPTPTPTSTR